MKPACTIALRRPSNLAPWRRSCCDAPFSQAGCASVSITTTCEGLSHATPPIYPTLHHCCVRRQLWLRLRRRLRHDRRMAQFRDHHHRRPEREDRPVQSVDPCARCRTAGLPAHGGRVLQRPRCHQGRVVPRPRHRCPHDRRAMGRCQRRPHRGSDQPHRRAGPRHRPGQCRHRPQAVGRAAAALPAAHFAGTAGRHRQGNRRQDPGRGRQAPGCRGQGPRHL